MRHPFFKGLREGIATDARIKRGDGYFCWNTMLMTATMNGAGH